MWLEKKILVPTDFSEAAMAAADIALELGQQFHVPLVLAHVYGTPGSQYPGVELVPTADFVHSVESAARAALNREADRLSRKSVDSSVVLSSGVAWERILETAKTVDAGLIVMGTHGRRGLPRAVLGSVAERVVRLARIPVLTVRAPLDESPESEK
jgi:nucleotide-binding universal stress UspA family protein